MELFKVGDRVMWLGMLGTVTSIAAGAVYPVEVTYDNNEDTDIDTFTADGRYWSLQEPPLQLVSRAKKENKENY